MRRQFPIVALGAALFTALVASACEKKGGPIEVSHVEPNAGATGGGDVVTIEGSGFVPGKTQVDVYFGRRKAQNVINGSSATINVVTANGDRGPVDVNVTFHDGKAFKIPNGFKFVPPADPSAVRSAWEKTEGEKK